MPQITLTVRVRLANNLSTHHILHLVVMVMTVNVFPISVML